jgi:hypothetical protein
VSALARVICAATLTTALGGCNSLADIEAATVRADASTLDGAGNDASSSHIETDAAQGDARDTGGGDATGRDAGDAAACVPLSTSPCRTRAAPPAPRIRARATRTR